MIHLAVGRGPSPLFGTAKLDTKKECLANSQTPMSHFMSLMSRFMSPWSFE